MLKMKLSLPLQPVSTSEDELVICMLAQLLDDGGDGG